MTLKQLTQWAADKSRFRTVEDYSRFGREYLAFLPHGLKTVIVAHNENCYRFFQYGPEGNFNVSRPINSELMLDGAQFDQAEQIFRYALGHIREIRGDARMGKIINRFIYTCQQCIGAALDALPAGQSNTARKINGDLFERYIRLILGSIGVEVRDGVVNVPVVVDGFISSAAALVAQRLCPACRQAMLASHVSREPAGAMMLQALGLTPIIHAGMALGEGTGAVALMPLIDMALAVYHQGSSFEGIQVAAYQPQQP